MTTETNDGVRLPDVEFTCVKPCGHEDTVRMWGLEDLERRKASLMGFPCNTCMGLNRLASGSANGLYRGVPPMFKMLQECLPRWPKSVEFVRNAGPSFRVEKARRDKVLDRLVALLEGKENL